MGIVIAFALGVAILMAAEKSPRVQVETDRIGKQIELTVQPAIDRAQEAIVRKGR